MKSTIRQLRNPAYTGPNRCIPCTVLNTFIAGCLAAGATFVSPVAGASMLLILLIVIWLRGYLIPGTPALTKQYLPQRVLRLFRMDRVDTIHSGLIQDPKLINDFAVDDYLASNGIIEPCSDVDDMCLTSPAEHIWREHLRTTSDIEEADISVLVQTERDEASFEQTEEGLLLQTPIGPIGRWPSPAAAIADMTAAQVLHELVPDWSNQSNGERSRILSGLRLFVPECPTTGGAVEMTEETVESCCSTDQIVVLSCVGSGDRLFEQKLVE